MLRFTLENRGEWAGDFVAESGVSLGNYLETTYVGPRSVEIVGGPAGRTAYVFPLVIHHSLVHDEAAVEAAFVTPSFKLARYLVERLQAGVVQTLRPWQCRVWPAAWYCPMVDGCAPVISLLGANNG